VDRPSGLAVSVPASFFSTHGDGFTARGHLEMATKTKSQRDPRRDELRRLGERVREQRRNRGMTQEALAEALDLSVAYVSLIERGGRNPPYTTVVSIARALGVAPAKIVAED
jgi:ribosome-binding protein aMBF1 (putative translation factor)